MASDELSKVALQQGNQLPYLFSDVDVAAVHRSIAQHEHVMASLDLEMEKHMQIIRQLQHKKEQHLAQIRHCKGMITLAKQLPLEILAFIFEECVRDGWTKTPILVSSVCSSWRKAAFTPTVWAHVYVSLDSQDPRRRTQLWLERSQAAPLVIHLEIGTDTSRLISIMEMLIEDAGRWKEFTIKSTLLHPVDQILQTWSAPMLQLCSVNIAIDQELQPSDPQANENAGQLFAFRHAVLNAPNLRKIRFERNLLPTPDTLPPCITHLTLTLPSLRVHTQQSTLSLLRVLEGLTYLETLLIEVPIPSMDQQVFDLESVQEVEIILPNLTSLTMMGARRIFGLLPHMKLPALNEINLRSSLEAVHTEETNGWLIRFFETTSHSLVSLEIRDLPLEETTYSQITSHLPSLRCLRLHDCDISDEALLQMSGSEGRCPSLEYLDLRWCGRLSGQALVEVVRDRMSRYGDIKSILEVTVINCSFVKEEDILNMAEFTTCRLVHRGSQDFCYSWGCCENMRYRKRFRQRLPFHKDRQARLCLILG
ncbi:hypothetical protein CPB83DRAFT_754526 [Crepidotus variabilis]|uniref:F-box domain-containing protein n=1 Tax=Crepidotus variabilis TaxID=179855 RepID=A0A9P6ETY6_9AGAR|nr:hypothetical protein CPB83DRAFT_754526 [Crepidotus variabilis]